MSNIFEIIDKTERKIKLTSEQFEHVICHKGMENYIEEIKDTLKNPSNIMSRCLTENLVFQDEVAS